jgi:ferritin-like protein
MAESGVSSGMRVVSETLCIRGVAQPSRQTHIHRIDRQRITLDTDTGIISTRGYTMSNEGYHEPITELSEETRDMHRAITSLMEELEAVDWYNQRVDACSNPELRAILAHNRDEEKEHAAMVLEWIRRQDPAFDKELKDYLFTDKPIAHE